MKTKTGWTPAPGLLACYSGRSGRLLRGGRLVQIVAEATCGRMVVQAIGHAGQPVQFTVLASNLAQPQPQLFD